MNMYMQAFAHLFVRADLQILRAPSQLALRLAQHALQTFRAVVGAMAVAQDMVGCFADHSDTVDVPHPAAPDARSILPHEDIHNAGRSTK